MNSPGVWLAILIWGSAQLTSGASISGTIRTPDGGPAANVRVVAMAVPDAAPGLSGAAVFESITQTDSNGRYRLENVSPGRHFIAAGPVSYQTFHPGTLIQSAATVVAVTSSSPLVSGVDFTLSPALSTAQGALPSAVQQQVGLVCCRLRGRFLIEGGSLAPDFPDSMKVIERRSGSSVEVCSSWKQIGYFPFTIALNATAEIAIDGLPPGYVLKSVAYGGKDFGLTPFRVDGQSTGTLDLNLGYEPVSVLKKVTALGRVINAAPESKVTSIRFASTMPNGPVPVARLQLDGSFEFLDIPAGVYQSGIIDPRGGANTSPNILVIRESVSGLVIDLKNNPFPEFYGIRPERTVFIGGKPAEISGVITQKITPIGGSSSVYFRTNVMDVSTGVVAPWAVFAERDFVPRIVVGETITVPGVLSTDGTNRISANPF